MNASLTTNQIMQTCTIEIIDEINIKLHNVALNDRKLLARKFEFIVPGSQHMPAVKLGRWDGKTSFFNVSGRSYLSLLPDIVDVLTTKQYDFEVVDRRVPVNYSFDKFTADTFTHKVWPKGHPVEGEPIVLRDYQIDVINSFLTNQQSIGEIATGAGKCLDHHTPLALFINASTASKFANHVSTKITTYDRSKPLLLSYGQWFELIESYRHFQFQDNVEVDVSKLDLYVHTPSGVSKVLWMIKKCNLPAVQVNFDTGSLICAEKHQLVSNSRSITVDQLASGDKIYSKTGTKTIQSIINIGTRDCYDIGIVSPHLYYDGNGILHHNTIITASLSYAAEKYGRTIVIVPNKSLVVQTEADYKNLGLDVGVYFGDRKELNRTHTICTWQSLHSMVKTESENIASVVQDVVCVMVDECHGCKASSLRELLGGIFSNVPLRWGLTGTIPKDPGERMALTTNIGPVFGKLAASDLQDMGVLAKCHVDIIQTQETESFTLYQRELKFLVTDSKRLDYIASKVLDIVKDGNTLVLIDRIETGKELMNRFGDRAVFVDGSTKLTERKEHYDQIANVDNQIIVATMGVASTGISIARLFNVVLIEAGKSYVRTIQAIGRGLRMSKDKDFVNIYDITSKCKFSKRHMLQRRKFYAEAGYPNTLQKVTY